MAKTIPRYSQKTNSFFPVSIVWGGYLFLLFGAAITIQNLVIGLLFSGLALLIVTGSEGLVIDFKAKKMRNFWGILGLKFGPWEDLPKLQSINIVRQGQVQSKKTTTGSRKRPGKKYEVRLRYKEFNDYILAYRGSLAHAKNKAQFLAHFLKLRIKQKS